jgi:hypothetical protein
MLDGRAGRSGGWRGRAGRRVQPGRSPGRKLVGAFRCPFVGQVERNVRRHDADQGHRRDVEALGDEARSDEDVQAPVGEGVDDPFRRAAVLDDVAVKPADVQTREGVADLALDPFRAASEVPDPGRGATGSAKRAALPAQW